MLALKAWGSSLRVATRRPLLACRYSDQLQLLSNLEQNILDDDLPPPTAGAAGYQTMQPPPPINPVTYANVSVPEARPFRLHCQATENNTINTFADSEGNVLAWRSGGRCGFKKGGRNSFEAGYQCAIQIFQDIAVLTEHKTVRIDLFFKGFGRGREAMQKALTTAEGDQIRQLLSSITDRSRVKVGGTRATKRRKV
ncbi:translational machinery component [Mycena floridula]|nr:translational machinery component [Mycena floridula]